MDDEVRKEQPERSGSASRALERRRSYVPARFETVEMEEAPDLRAYWRVLWKRRWTILTIFFVLFTVVLIGTLKQTPIYRAVAMLEIRKENPDLVTLEEVFQLESVSDTYLETQYKILGSDSLARRVIEELSLYELEEFNPPPPWWRSWISSSEGDEEPAEKGQIFSVGTADVGVDRQTFQKTLQNFVDRLGVEPVKRSRLVEVRFESEDPELAARVVNTLANNYIEQNLEARWEATQKASEWLTEQLSSLKARLEKSEEELQRYARENGLLFLESEQGNAENIVNQRLRRLQEELTRAQAIRYEKESLYSLLEAGEYASLPGVFDNKLIQDLSLTLAELKRRHADLLTTFTPDYPKVKELQSQIDEIEGALAQERERAAERIRNDYLAAVTRENLLRQAFEVQQEEANLVAEKSVQYNILKREVETNRQLYEGLLQRLREAGVSAGLKASNIRIVDPAEPPEKPAKPKPLLNLALAIILGLGLGVGAAFLQEYLDNTLKTSEDVERFLRVPALALIPSVESLNGRRGGVYGLYDRGSKLLTSGGKGSAEMELPGRSAPATPWYRIDEASQQHSTLAEAFRSLRTSVLLSTAERPPRSLLVTSSQPSEGKTTISLNLAISLAQLGQRVLLIDADMRRPCLHKAFEIKDSSGLASYLTGQQEWQALVVPTGVAGLDAVPCGPVPPNPAELLSSERMRTLIREAMAVYKFTVLDSPPLLGVADSRILATLVEGIVLVVQGGATPRELVQRAQSHARDVDANVIGVVLNNLDVRSDDYYYYRYYRYDYYGSREGTSEKT
ncbi:polysaccharide biosynthesis tyrosine autokinase [Acidobacteriia bacterium AH_259_A11_L15]|nr:polysaccharide biosynthesis tyrosine autokinase [Acidobacteriia bacterium AH_259_A11_L15]